jgi:predicted dehydrogenase
MSLRVAVIGTGFGARVVADCYREAGMAVEIVSPRDPQAVRAACARDVDLVSIHSPPFLHADHVALALDHGRNVLCDKPFGVSAAESRAMLAQADAAGVLHFLNFEFRADPARFALKELIDAGAIGPVRHVHWTAFNSGSRVPLRRHGWLFDKALGGGWIGAYGSHVFDALRWLIGEVVAVAGEVRSDIAERPDARGTKQTSSAEDAFVARLRFAGGATALIDTTFAAPANLPPRITIFGADGLIEAVGATAIHVRGSGNDRDIHFDPFVGDPHLPAMRPWAAIVRDAVAEGRQIAPNFRDGAACAEIMDRLRAAAAA